MGESAGASRKTTARIVWDTADKYLRNVVDEEDYGDYILPFTVLRRLECMLHDSKDDVIKYVDAFAGMPQHLIDIAVKDRFGLGFYNVSPLDLVTIASVDDNVDKSLKSYIDGFSNNIADIWVSFDFNRRAKVLADANRLHAVVKHFSNLDLSPGSLSDTSMGDVFEDVMYRAFNKKGKAAGNFYTPRDAIKLMVDVLIANDDDTLAGDSTARSIYDPTAGSGGMLLIAQEALRRMNETIDVTLYGQELMPSAFALGKADLLIQGGRPDAVKQGNTLVEDLYEGQTFDYVLSNPPFGKDWSADQAQVRDEAKESDSRFSHGLPGTSDGQMLFLAHCASKLSPAGRNGEGGGRAAVVSNASPLFTSDNGPTAIRQWLLDEDLIDAIIGLPSQMFYGTGIATYVWILDSNKEPERKGKIQLIDASEQWEPLPKAMGEKRRQLSKVGRGAVLEAFRAFDTASPDISRVMTTEDFMFLDVPLTKQARLATHYSADTARILQERNGFTEGHASILSSLADTPWNELPGAIRARATAAGIKFPISMIDAAVAAMAVRCEEAPLAVDRKGNPVAADGWKLTERVPLSQDVSEHMEREVRPFAPDAQWMGGKAKPGNEIPFNRIFYGDGARLLRSVADDWEVIPAWALFEERGERALPGDVHLTPSQHLGVIPQEEYMELTGNRVVLNISGSDSMKAVRAGDYIIHLRSFQGGIEAARMDGKVSAAYTVLKPVSEVDGEYFRHFFKSEDFITELANLTFQLRDGQTVNYARFARMKFPVPPLSEQARIASVLNDDLSRIDLKMSKIEQMKRDFEDLRSELVTGRKEARFS